MMNLTNKLLSFLLAGAMVLTLTSCGKKEPLPDQAPEGASSAESSLAAEGSSEEKEEAPDQSAEDAVTYHPLGVGYYKDLGINPYTCTNAQNQTLMGLCFEGLFELNDAYEPVPCLVSSFSVKVKKTTTEQPVPTKTDSKKAEKTAQDTQKAAKDTKTDAAPDKQEPAAEVKTVTVTSYTTKLTLTVRNGVKFSDGSGLHADDVVYSLQKAAAKGSIYRSRLIRMKEAVATGKDTLTVTFSGGLGDAAALLTFPIVKSETGDDLFPIGTGPYAAQLKKGSLRRFTANEKWWRLGLEEGSENGETSPNLLNPTMVQPVNTIKVCTYEDSDDLIFGFTSSQLCAAPIDFTDSAAPEYTSTYTVTDYPTSTLLYLGCNTQKGKLCHSQTLRHGIYKAIDREIFATRMMARHALGTALPVSPRSRWYSQELEEELGYDAEAAASLIKEANVNGTLRLIVNRDSAFKSAAAVELKKDLEQLGLNVNVDKLEWKAFTEALKKGDYDLYLGEVRLDANFDLTRLVAAGGSLNYSNYSHQSLEDVRWAYHSADPEKKVEIDGVKVSEKEEAAKEYFTEFAKRAPIIPLAFKNNSLLTKDNVLTNPQPNQQTIYARMWRWKVTEGVKEASK